MFVCVSCCGDFSGCYGSCCCYGRFTVLTVVGIFTVVVVAVDNSCGHGGSDAYSC